MLLKIVTAQLEYLCQGKHLFRGNIASKTTDFCRLSGKEEEGTDYSLGGIHKEAALLFSGCFQERFKLSYREDLSE